MKEDSRCVCYKICAKRVIFFILFLVYSFNGLLAQNVDKLTKNNALKMSGGISASTVFYGVSGIERRRDPFYWQFNANLNFKILGVSVPFSASFSQQERNFTQPFNQYGLSPKYKSVQLHLGYRTMSFSPYTLGGKTFLGAGLEVKPKGGKIQGSILYGRFTRAVQKGGNDGAVVGIAAYERWGYGAKLRYGTEKNNIGWMFFRGRDKENSLNRNELLEPVLPEENLVWGVNTKHKIGKKITVELEYAFSAYTKNILNSEIILENFSYYNNLGRLITPNVTTQFNKAITSSLTYAEKKYNVQLAYRRIDPEYQTMGSPFLNNDMEEVTGALSWKINKGKINVTTTGGFQRNNLDEQEVARVVRAVAGLNVSYAVNKKLNLSSNYSNYNTSTNKVQFINIDSIKYFQVTHNISLGLNYKLGKSKKVRQSLMIMSSLQRAFDSEDNNTNISNSNLGYQFVMMNSGLTIGSYVNYSISKFQELKSTNIGPSLTLAKPFLKRKVQTSFTYSLLQVSSAGETQNVISNYQFTTRYTWKKKHNFSLAGVLLNRQNKAGTQSSFSERRITIQYGYRF